MARTIGDVVLVRDPSASALSAVFGDELAAHSSAPYHCWTLRAHSFAGGSYAGRISKPALPDYPGVVRIPDDRQRWHWFFQTRSVMVKLLEFLLRLVDQRTCHIEQHICRRERLRFGNVRFRTEQLAAGTAQKRISREI